MADFILVSRRTLDEFEYKVFKFHFLLGADLKFCCQRLSIDRARSSTPFIALSRSCGPVFRELEPYGLFPLDEYFHGSVRAAGPIPVRTAEMPRIRTSPVNRGLRAHLQQISA